MKNNEVLWTRFFLLILAIDVRECEDCSLALPACLVWLSSYVTRLCLAVVPQSGAKENFYCTVYYITLNSNCDIREHLKNWKKIRRKNIEAKINAQVISVYIFYFFKEKIGLKVTK